MSHTPIPEPLILLVRRYVESEHTLIRLEVSPDGLAVVYLEDGRVRYVHHDMDGNLTITSTGREA